MDNNFKSRRVFNYVESIKSGLFDIMTVKQRYMDAIEKKLGGNLSEEEELELQNLWAEFHEADKECIKCANMYKNALNRMDDCFSKYHNEVYKKDKIEKNIENVSENAKEEVVTPVEEKVEVPTTEPLPAPLPEETTGEEVVTPVEEKVEVPTTEPLPAPLPEEAAGEEVVTPVEEKVETPTSVELPLPIPEEPVQQDAIEPVEKVVEVPANAELPLPIPEEPVQQAVAAPVEEPVQQVASTPLIPQVEETPVAENAELPPTVGPEAIVQAPIVSNVSMASDAVTDVPTVNNPVTNVPLAAPIIALPMVEETTDKVTKVATEETPNPVSNSDASLHFVKINDDETKAILVSKEQKNKLSNSYSAQRKIIDSNFLSQKQTEEEITPEKMEQMMNQLSTLYAEGKVDEAEKMSAEIQELSTKMSSK